MSPDLAIETAALKAAGARVLRVWLNSARRRPQARLILADALQERITLELDPVALSGRVSQPGLAAYALAELADAGIGLQQFALGQPSLDEA